MKKLKLLVVGLLLAINVSAQDTTTHITLTRAELVNLFEEMAKTTFYSNREAAQVLYVLAAAIHNNSEGGFAQFCYWWAMNEAKRLEIIKKQEK